MKARDRRVRTRRRFSLSIFTTLKSYIQRDLIRSPAGCTSVIVFTVQRTKPKENIQEDKYDIIKNKYAEIYEASCLDVNINLNIHQNHPTKQAEVKEGILHDPPMIAPLHLLHRQNLLPLVSQQPFSCFWACLRL